MATASELGSLLGVFCAHRGVFAPIGGYPGGVQKGGFSLFYPLYTVPKNRVLSSHYLPYPPLLAYRGLILGPFGITIASALLSLRSLEYGHPRVHCCLMRPYPSYGELEYCGSRICYYTAFLTFLNTDAAYYLDSTNTTINTFSLSSSGFP